MAADKKTTAKVEAPKTAAKKAATDTKAAAPVQAEAEKKETIKSEAAAVKKTVEKKATEAKKTVEKKAAEAKKTVEKKAAEAKKTVAAKTTGRGRKAGAKKAELKSELHLQFGGNSYTQDELVKIAKDVWKYDLKQKVGDLESIELYVKPEEHAVYYVMNKDFTGSFYI